MGGSLEWQVFLFLLAGAFALLLLLGLHTRIATLACWALFASLHVRNPIMLSLGDHFLRQVLFWCVFLPLGRCWSLDALRAREPGRSRSPVFEAASVALLLQIAFLYFFTALLKRGPDWHEDGTAVYYAMHRDFFVTSAALYLREFTGLMEFVTRLTLAFEYLGPLLLFSPLWTGPVRTATVFSFWLFHLSLALCIRIGLFPWICIVVVTTFLPAWFWDRVAARFSRRPAAAVARAAREVAPWRARLQVFTRSAAAVWLKAAVVSLILLYVFLQNLTSVTQVAYLPESAVEIGHRLGINQRWGMYSPNIDRDDGWFVFPGTLADGSRVDLSDRGPALSWEKPQSISATHGWFPWAKLLSQLKSPRRNAGVRRAFAGWLCREWNATHTGEQRLLQLEIVFMLERTPEPSGQATVRRRLLLEHRCAEPPAA
jgi:hypothetical protein